MKSYLGCEKKSVLGQTPYSFTSRHERSVRKVQSLIFQARVQGKIADVHALQEQLCDSFCAKLLATEYAISSIETSYVNKAQSLISSLLCQQKLRGNAKSRGDVVPLLSHPLSRGLSQKKDTSTAEQSFVRASQKQSKKKFNSVMSAPFVRRGLKTSWEIFLAKSLWSDNKVNQVICNDTCFSAKEKDFQEQTQQFQSRHFCLKANKGKKGRCSISLEESVKGKICQTAQQIHALLALEPEWQAVFVLQRNCQGKEKIVDGLIASKTSSVNVRKDQIPLCNQNGTKQSFVKHRTHNCTVVGTQLFTLQSSDCVSVKPEPVIKQIREHLEGSFPRYVVTASIKDWLHTIDHQALINQLNTFPKMRKRIHDCLKAGILQTNQIALQGVRNPFNKENTCLSASCANLWRIPIFRQSSKPVKLSSQSGSSSPYLRYSLYSAFPETLWKQLDRVYDVMQIENYSQSREHVIFPLFTRIVLHGLQEKVQQCADKLVSACSKYNALCLRRGKQLCFVSLKHIKREFVDRQFTQREKDWASRNSLTSVACQPSNPCFVKNRQNFLCSAHQHHLVIICPDKELLEICVSRAKDYLLQITRVNSELSVKQSQQAFLNKRDKSQAREIKFTNGSFPRQIDKANILSASDLGCHFFASQGKFGFQCLFSKVQDCRQGFSFLGFQVIQIQEQNRYVCTITPSRESVRDLLLLITNQIRQSRSVSTNIWINRLNPLLLRWVEYYKHCEYKSSYNQISYLIWEKTRTWLARRRRKKTQTSRASRVNKA